MVFAFEDLRALALTPGDSVSPCCMNTTIATVMAYGADAGAMLASLVALATLRLSLRRAHGQHRRGQCGE
jgi:hypothetical protein